MQQSSLDQTQLSQAKTNRTRWVMGNWKMNPKPTDARVLAQALIQDLNANPCSHCKVAIAPSMLQIGVVQGLIDAHASMPSTHEAAKHGLHVVAQDVSTYEGFGAFTGEVSAQMISESGLGLVLVGHSERRSLLKEDEATLALKLKRVFDAGLTAVLCVGETLVQREAGQAVDVVTAQLAAQIEAVDVDVLANQLIIAYEPVWAIGTGKTASAQDAQNMHAAIRAYLTRLSPRLNSISLLYGGSVKVDNAATFAACLDVDGVLVGGASLDAQSFIAIAHAFNVA